MARIGWTLLLGAALGLGAGACGSKGKGAQSPPVATPDPQTQTPTPGTTPTPTPTPTKNPGITFGTPGPWPVENVTYGAADGIQESPIVAVTSDEAENRWVATPRALYVLRPGDKAFRRFDETDGLHLGAITGRTPGPVGWAKYCNLQPIASDAPCGSDLVWGGADTHGILSLVGGGPNEVFVGYSGTHAGYNSSATPPICPDDKNGEEGYDWCDPDAHSGKVDWVRLEADGTLTVVRFDFLSNNHGRKFWHDRIVYKLAYDHFVHPGTLYAGTEHGTDLVFPGKWTPLAQSGLGFDAWINTWLGDHLHAVVCYHETCPLNSSQGLRVGDWRGLDIAADGQLWQAGFFSAGRIRWDPDPADWVARNGAAFSAAFGDPYPVTANAEGYQNDPVFKVTAEGDYVQLSGVAVCPDGKVWFSSLGPQTGTTHTVARFMGSWFDTWDATALGLPENAVQDIACLPDGRVVLAGRSSGLVLYDPVHQTSKAIRAGQGLPSDQVIHVEVDRMTNPPSLHVATAGGAAILRVLP